MMAPGKDDSQNWPKGKCGKVKGVPQLHFKNEDEERESWATHSPLDYFDIKDFKRASFPKLKPLVKSISIRLPEDMLAELKTLANKKDVPYQSLANIYLARQISLERGSSRMATKKNGQKVIAQHQHEQGRSQTRACYAGLCPDYNCYDFAFQK